jgi:hypothetical protein
LRVTSRGLGDVYKRQERERVFCVRWCAIICVVTNRLLPCAMSMLIAAEQGLRSLKWRDDKKKERSLYATALL